jgi:hypothetical protein
METKKCSKCKKVKNTTEFNKSKARKDNLCCYCKICNRKYQKEYLNKNENIRIKNYTDCLKNNAKYIKELSDTYIKNILNKQGVSSELITPELIELKRKQLKIFRECQLQKKNLQQ